MPKVEELCFGFFGSFEWLVVSIWKMLKTYYYHECFESLFFSWWDPMNYLDRIWDDKILKEKTSAACRYCVKGGSSYRWLVDYDRNVWMVEKCTPHGFCFKMGWCTYTLAKVWNSQLFDDVEILYFPHKDRGDGKEGG